MLPVALCSHGTLYNCCTLWWGPWRFVHQRGKMALEAKPRVPYSMVHNTRMNYSMVNTRLDYSMVHVYKVELLTPGTHITRLKCALHWITPVTLTNKMALQRLFWWWCQVNWVNSLVHVYNDDRDAKSRGQLCVRLCVRNLQICAVFVR